MNEADGVAQTTAHASWLSRHEHDLARQLRNPGVSFVAEVPIDTVAIRRSQQEYGFLAAQMSRQNIDRSRLVSWYPALSLVLLVDTAARCESLEQYWPQYFADLECVGDEELRHVLESVTPELLRNFGLLDITELDADFTAILAGQAAIPTLHTTELVELAERYLEMGPITDEYHFAQWLATLDAAHRSAPDRTVQRFARYGGRLASDVLDGVVDLVVRSGRPATGPVNTASHATASLPTALHRSLHDLLVRRRPRRTAPAPAEPAPAQPMRAARTSVAASTPQTQPRPAERRPLGRHRPVPITAAPAPMPPTREPMPAASVPTPSVQGPTPAASVTTPPAREPMPPDVAPVTDPFRPDEAAPTVLLNLTVPDGMVDPWDPLDAESVFSGRFPSIEDRTTARTPTGDSEAW